MGKKARRIEDNPVSLSANPKRKERRLLERNQRAAKGEVATVQAGSRSDFLRILRNIGLAGVLLTAGVVAYSLNNGNSSKTVSLGESGPSVPEAFDKERDTDRLISVVENAWEGFSRRVEPLISQVDDKAFRDEIESPFQLMKLNKANPNKNGTRFHRQQSELGNSTADIANAFWFFIESDPNLLSDQAAGFEPLSAIMHLSPDFDPNDDVDMLILYHELRHVAQSARTKMQIRGPREYDEYVDFHTGPKRRMLINEEASAYAYEIEVLNLLCGGELSRAAQEGRAVDMNLLHSMIKTKRVRTLETLVYFAQHYYPEGAISGHFSQRFLEMLAEEYAKFGYEVYIFLNTGELVRMK